jgi:ankyrin repeat protein
MYLLTQKDINANFKGRLGRTLLHQACQKINSLPLEIFQHLIETLGCDVNAQDNNNETPLHHALYHFDPNKGDDITVLMYLLSQKGVTVNIKGLYDTTLLHIACININTLPIDIFKFLIETHGCGINVPDYDGYTPIHRALDRFDPNEGGNITVLAYLFSQKGIDGNITYLLGRTLLHIACKNINTLPIEVFKLLIETLGCDVHAQDNRKDTPLHRAIDYFNPNDGGKITVLTYLHTKHFNGHNLLHYACVGNHYSSRNSVELSAKYDTISCQIVEVIVERCIEEVLDERTTP